MAKQVNQAKQPDPVPVSRPQRMLATIGLTIIGLSILAIIAVIIGTAVHADQTSSIWVTIAVLPLIGFPIGILCILALLIITTVRRSRAAKGAGQ